MKIGNLVEGFEVVDVKRVRQMHPVRQYKEVCEYLDKGYKIDYKSAKVVGLVHEVDVYKLETAKSEAFETKTEKQPNVKVEVVEDILGDTLTTEEGIGEVEVPVKKTTSTRKKTT